MDTEDLEIHDMTKERQEEEREEEEETSFDWDSFVNNLENFSDNASQYEGNLPNLPIPPPSHPIVFVLFYYIIHRRPNLVIVFYSVSGFLL